jgi:hypothetical protein
MKEKLVFTKTKKEKDMLEYKGENYYFEKKLKEVRV